MERSEFLQLMRFVAAALVLAAHVTFYYHDRVDREVPIWEPGGVGVPIFFVISGIVMVVASQQLPPGLQGARAFFIRRVLRIVPLWWLALLLKVAVALAWPQSVNHNHFQFDHAVKSFFFVPYFTATGDVVPLHGVGWTLLHEMYFYLLFGLALWLGLKPVRWVSGTIALLVAMGQAVQLDAAWWVVATSPMNLQFVLGMMLAAVLQRPEAPKMQRHALAALALGAAALLAVLPAADKVPFVVPVLMAFAAAVLWLAQRPMPRAAQWMVRLGDSSYSLYLFHPFVAPALVLLLARLAPGLPPAVHLPLVFGATIAIAHVLHRVVEVPTVAMARRHLARPRGAALAT